MNLANPAEMREQKGRQLPKGEPVKTVNYIQLKCLLLRLIIPVFPTDGEDGPAEVS